MSLLDRGLARSCFAQERLAQSPFSGCLLFPRRHPCYCSAKAKPDNDSEGERQLSHKGFSIQVPTIPKIGDIESARRLLESAFHNFSIDIPKIPIESALQSFPFAIPKLAKPMRILVLDITGFVTTRLKKRQKRELEDIVVVDDNHPRSAWPRACIKAPVTESRTIGSTGELQGESASHQIAVGPHFARPRANGGLANCSGAMLSSNKISHPRSEWPRQTKLSKTATLTTEQSLMAKEDVLPCTIDGGARCPWPRKGIRARHTSGFKDSVTDGDNEEALKDVGELSDVKAVEADLEKRAELPRRVLATTVALTALNHFGKGSMIASVSDLCGSLPAGFLGFSDDEGAPVDVGRRALLVVIRGSIGTV